MSKVGFFTAISFGPIAKSPTQSLLETVDNYFYLGGKKAFVIKGHTKNGSEGAILKDHSQSYLVTAIKVISYATLIIPAIILIAKILLRSTHTFHLIQKTKQFPSFPIPIVKKTIPLTPQEQLEEGINITLEIVQKIKSLMPRLIKGEISNEIIWYSWKPNIRFSLKAFPEYVFKMAGPDVYEYSDTAKKYCYNISPEQNAKTAKRYENMIKAVEICSENKLNLLVVPHAKKFDIDNVTIIAEQSINVVRDESLQDDFYHLSGLNEAVKQLTTFIAKTGYCDIQLKNAPVIDTDPRFQGNRRIAILDLEKLDDPTRGIFGGENKGLIWCLRSNKHIDIAFDVARENGIFLEKKYENALKKECKKSIQLHKFYKKNGILDNPKKLIQVDNLNTLNLPLEEEFISTSFLSYETKKTLKMKDIAQHVINAINNAIENADHNQPTESRRRFDIHLSNLNDDLTGKLRKYWNFGSRKPCVIQIVKALADKGYLFHVEILENSSGIVIQA